MGADVLPIFDNWHVYRGEEIRVSREAAIVASRGNAATCDDDQAPRAGRWQMRYSRGYPSWTKSGHELALVPINPVVRRRTIDPPIFQRRAKPTANDLYVAIGAAVQEAAPPRAEVPTVLVNITPYAFRTSA